MAAVIDALGVSDGYEDTGGRWHPIDEETRAALHASMGSPGREVPGLWFVPAGATERLWSPCHLVLEDGTALGLHDRLPDGIPVGYHRLCPADGGPASTLVVHPERCPEAPRAWGVAAQVYALWSERSWGIGDLADVAALGRRAADHGARVMLLSPLHSAAPTAEQENSPYSPSSRCWWHPLLLPVSAPPPQRHRVQPSRLIDRDAVWAAKQAYFWEEFQDVRDHDRPWLAPTSSGDPAPAGSWAAAAARDIGLFAAWSALAERHGADWDTWPEPLRRPSAAVLDHVAADTDLAHVAEFHAWLQWRLHGELTALGPGRGPVALIGDMAVGITPKGYDAWRFQDLLAMGDARIGAPPDELAPEGQNWGLPPFVPWKLRAVGYRPLIDTLRAVFTGMSGIRIDHVMGLFRQYWALPGDGGGYVHYPADELLAIVAIEAQRAGAFVVGEDLGTVPPEVPPAMAARGMLGTKVVVLDDDPPSAWPAACVGTLTTHDLPTMAGVLAGDGPDEMRVRLAGAMAERGGAAAIEVLGMSAGDTVPADRLRERLIAALHDAVLDSPARLRLVTTDDLCATPLRENVPGTVGPPNWCRPLPHPVADIPWDSVRDRQVGPKT